MEVRSRRPNEPAQITAAKFGSRILTIEAGGEAMLPLAINPLIPSDHVESRGYGYGRVGVTLSMGEKLLQRRARALQRQHQTRYPSIVAQDGNVTAGLIMSAAAALDLADLVGNLQHDQQEHYLAAGGEAEQRHYGQVEIVGDMFHGGHISWAELKSKDVDLADSIRKYPSLHIAEVDLLVKTNRGVTSTIITGTAVRTNDYGLPSSLTFHPAVTSGGDRPTDGANEYDLYLRNPHEGELYVSDVFSSNPREVIIEQARRMPPPHRARNGNLKEIDSMCDYSVSLVPRRLDRGSLEEDGPPIVVPGECGYIGTVRLLDLDAHGDVNADDVTEFLSHVQIRTQHGLLSIAVERASNFTSRGRGDVEASGLRVDNNSIDPRLEGADWDKFMLPGLGIDSDDAWKEIDVSESGAQQSTSILSVSPSELDFGLLTSSISHSHFVPINITNNGPEILQLMRVAVVDVTLVENQSLSSRLGDNEGVDEPGLLSYIHFGRNPRGREDGGIGPKTADGAEEILILPGQTIEGQVWIKCAPTASRLNSVPVSSLYGAKPSPKTYAGSAVVRAGLASIGGYQNWKRAMAENPLGNTSNHAVVEVKIKANVFIGLLKYDLHDTYFATDLAASMPGTDERTIGGSSRRRTIITTNGFSVPVSIYQLTVSGMPTSAIGGDSMHLESTLTKRCRERFGVVGPQGTPSASVELARRMIKPNEAFGEIELWHMNTNIGSNQGLDRDRCSLLIELDIELESYPRVYFVLPLHEYDGRILARLDTRAAQRREVVFLNSRRGDLNMDIAQGRMSRSLSAWYKNSTIGQALRRHIKIALDVQENQPVTKQGGKRVSIHDIEQKDVDELLTFLSRDGDSVTDLNLVNPVVLDIGVLVASSVRSFSLYLTNPNPFVATIMADHNGSLEGISIQLGRVEAMMTDILGSKPQSLDSIHSDEEYLRHFLSSSPTAQSLFGRLSYVDDIGPATSTDYIGINPDLLKLYGHHASRHIHSVRPGLQEITPSNYSCFGGSDSKSLGHADDGVDNRGFDRRILLTSGGLICPTEQISPSTKNKTFAYWRLPPSSTARFDIRVRFPPHSVLEHKDGVTSFVSTGLALRTNFGQVLPIVVSYSRLGGDFTVMKSGYNGVSGVKEVQMPANILPFRDIERNLYENDFVHESYLKDKSIHLSVKWPGKLPIAVKRFDSCSPWFNIIFEKESRAKNRDSLSLSTPDPSIDISVHSSIRCENNSFLACAFSFLESPDLIQPPGCGLAQEDSRDFDYHHSTIARVKTSATAAFRKANNKMRQIYTGQVNTKHYFLPSSSHRDGILTLSPADVQPFLEAKVAWGEISKFGLNKVTGQIRVVAARSQNETGNASEMSIPLHLPLLSSNLDYPSLLLENPLNSSHWVGPSGSDHELGTVELQQEIELSGTRLLRFPITLVSDLAVAYIPVHNPSGLPIRVQLGVLSDEEGINHDFVKGLVGQSDKETDLLPKVGKALHIQHDSTRMNSSDLASAPGEAMGWWNGIGYYQQSSDGMVTKSQHNMAVVSKVGEHGPVINPGIHAKSALVLGCSGRRCGLHDSKKFQGQPGQHLNLQQQSQNLAQEDVLNSRNMMSSPIGASAAIGEILRGRSYNPDNGQESLESVKTGRDLGSIGRVSSPNMLPEPFAINTSAMQEKLLSPGQKVLLGPIFFRPPSQGQFGTTLLIQNTLTGVEAVKFRGDGGVQLAGFLEVREIDEGVAATDIDSPHGVSTHLENRFGFDALIFPGTAPPNSVGRGVQRKVRIANRGNMAVEFGSIYMSSSSVAHFTHRQRRSFDTQSAESESRNGKTIGCEIENFRIVGCVNDARSRQNILSTLSSVFLGLFGYSFKPPIETVGENLRHGFALKPNESKVLTISHSPDCLLEKSFVTLHLEYSSHGVSSSSKRSELLGSTKMELLVGYDGLDTSGCVPAAFTSSSSVYHFLSYCRQAVKVPRTPAETGLLAIYLAFAILMITVIISLCEIMSAHNFRARSAYRFGTRTGMMHTVFESMTEDEGSTVWQNVFRCLARSDPNPADLSQLGNDQTQLLVLARYEKKGAISPQCLRPNGIFAREARGNNTRGGALTLSDIIFCRYDSSFVRSDWSPHATMPIGLGWRDAAARGIIPTKKTLSTSGDTPPKITVGNRTRELLKKRVEELEQMASLPVGQAVVVAESKEEGESMDDVILPEHSTSKFSGTTPAKRDIENGARDSAGINLPGAPPLFDEEREDDIASLLSHQAQLSTSSRTSKMKHQLPSAVFEHMSSSNNEDISSSHNNRGGKEIEDFVDIVSSKGSPKDKRKKALLKRPNKEQLDETPMVSSIGMKVKGKAAKTSSIKAKSKLHADPAQSYQKAAKRSESSGGATNRKHERGATQSYKHLSRDMLQRQTQGRDSLKATIHRNEIGSPAIPPSSMASSADRGLDQAKASGILPRMAVELMGKKETQQVACLPLSPAAGGTKHDSQINGSIFPPPGIAPPPGFSAKKNEIKCEDFQKKSVSVGAQGTNALSLSPLGGDEKVDPADAPWLKGNLSETEGKDWVSDFQDDSGNILSNLLEDTGNKKVNSRCNGSGDGFALGNTMRSTSARNMTNEQLTNVNHNEDEPLLGLGGGFNVMNFLDTILDDSGHTDEIEGDTDAAAGKRNGVAGSQHSTIPACDLHTRDGATVVPSVSPGILDREGGTGSFLPLETGSEPRDGQAARPVQISSNPWSSTSNGLVTGTARLAVPSSAPSNSVDEKRNGEFLWE